VDFQRSEDQLALQQGVRSFCEGRISIDQLREHEGRGGFDRALWAELAELGTFSLHLAESDGGVGLGCADAVLVFEELGRSLAPGPLVWTHLAADRVEGAALGQTVVGGIDLADGGPPYLIEYLDQLDVLWVLRPDGVEQVDPTTLDATPVATPLDPLTPVHQVQALPRGEHIGDAEYAEELRLRGAALTGAAQLGIAEATLELALDYAKKREQFDRPIGSFPAIKHMFADMFVRQEAARAAVYAAGATLDDPEVGDRVRAVAAARILGCEAAMKNARRCIQIHGGMGYTWEVPAHYYLKRAWVLENVFGSADEYADRVSALTEAGIA
jgi:alkylation response protein AidB-like acyl-CoA dehydrogenase